MLSLGETERGLGVITSRIFIGCSSNRQLEARHTPLLQAQPYDRGGRTLKIERGGHRPAALAEANPSESFAIAIAAQRHLVGIDEVAAFFPARQRQRLASIRRQFEETAAAVVLGAGDRAGSKDVASAQVAAVAGVVRQHLCDRPIQLAKGTAADGDR